MLRALFLYLSNAAWARRIVTGWSVSRRAASRFVAGDQLSEAVAVVGQLNARGLFATLDHLGEHVGTPDEARRAAKDYLILLDQLCLTGARANASLKLTQLGLGVDSGLCMDNVRRVAQRAAECGVFVRIDMEDSPTVDRTLELRQSLEHAGHHNVGVVIQAYLYRSLRDVQTLLESGVPIRLCKGAYREPPAVAFARKADVDLQFDTLAAMMIDASLSRGCPASTPDGRVPAPVALATHDERRIDFARRYAAQAGFPRSALEFQFLHGIRGDLQLQLAQAGYPVRVYVPYGTEWYPYFMRRLAERPANLWFFVSNYFRR